MSDQSQAIRQRHTEITADAACRGLLECLVTRDRRPRFSFWIPPNVVFSAVVMEFAPVLAKVFFEFAAFHDVPPLFPQQQKANSPPGGLSPAQLAYFFPATEGRRVFALDAFSAAAASSAISNASSKVSASVTSPGMKGDVTVNPPSSAASKVNTIFPLLTVYFVGFFAIAILHFYPD
jgi:hypothetical protein